MVIAVRLAREERSGAERGEWTRWSRSRIVFRALKSPHYQILVRTMPTWVFVGWEACYNTCWLLLPACVAHVRKRLRLSKDTLHPSPCTAAVSLRPTAVVRLSSPKVPTQIRDNSEAEP